MVCTLALLTKSSLSFYLTLLSIDFSFLFFVFNWNEFSGCVPSDRMTNVKQFMLRRYIRYIHTLICTSIQSTSTNFIVEQQNETNDKRHGWKDTNGTFVFQWSNLKTLSFTTHTHTYSTFDICIWPFMLTFNKERLLIWIILKTWTKIYYLISHSFWR